MTKAEIKKTHDAMARFLIRLCADSDRIYSGYRTGDCEKNYRAAARLIRRAGFKYEPSK